MVRLFTINEKFLLSFFMQSKQQKQSFTKQTSRNRLELANKIEFTGRKMLQCNHLAEVGFATVAAIGRAMMSNAKISKHHWKLFWQEAFQTATYLQAGKVTKSPVEHFEG
jgi:hypothetical protein